MSTALLQEVKSLATSVATLNKSIADYKTENDSLRAEVATHKKALEKIPATNAAALLHAEPIDHKKEGMWGFSHMGEFLFNVKKAKMTGGMDVDERLTNIQKSLAKVQKGPTGMNEGIGPDGGFPLPPTFVNQIMEIMHAEYNLLDETDKVEATSPTVKMPAVDETSRVDGSRRGGVLSYWVGEGNALTASRPKFKLLEATAHKLTVLIYATDELMMDSGVVGQTFPRYATEEIIFRTNDAIIRGTGAGQPFGILNSAARVTVTKESGQPAATILSQNILKMYTRMHFRSTLKANWYINQDIWQQLFQMTLGTAGAQLVTFIPPGGLSASPYGTLMGRPVQPIEQASTLGTEGDIIFADMKQYWSITRGNVNEAMSIHVAFLTDEQVFRWTFRVDGMPWWTSPLTPFKGSATQSPFITLQSR